MWHFNKSLVLGGSLALAAMLGASGAARAQEPLDALGAAVGTAVGVAGGYAFGGHNYCWYPGGWRGPGWYWCGYGARRGYGWGGGEGFHGWHHGGRGGRGNMRGHGRHDMHGHGGDHRNGYQNGGPGGPNGQPGH
ncbi:hypothetical protein [Methylovirgula sp. HY1]|uniref:hypothetical protein n=1 Tax=Methylovirgula sp. HY1 TaxID=2822761 RepID=UPI001C7946CE|nr:hypothetical protein [Methylovirgula sp. HY1]QXX75766.1 hypothetical protein MHY1_02597 [Methylovirgula sp. HY1]